LAASLGCEQSAYDHLADARRGLSDAVYADAIAAAEAGLAASPDSRAEWGLELVKLEALARAGHGDEAGRQLSTLENTYPERIAVTQYAATAGQLRDAGQGPQAIQVLDYGLKRFPDDPMLTRLLGVGNSAGLGSAELDMLRSLGYVE
jgi:tetratricopeptide (TPR) repeat protein